MSLSINKDITNNIEFIKDCYSHSKADENGSYFQLITSPFKVLKLKNFLSSDNYRRELKTAVENLPLNRKDNDLYSFWQNEDLHNCELKPIKKFRHILEKEVHSLLSEICGVTLNEKISVTLSLYKQEDVLLCHDDKCEDRCIAFVYYLTGSDNSGGSFDMFDHDDIHKQPSEVVCRIPPEENSLVCFIVGHETYHQVSEVTSEHFRRWSINGWFHSDRKISQVKYVERMPPLQDQKVLENPVLIDQYMNVIYHARSTLTDMQKEFEDTSFILLKDIFQNDFYKSCSKELINNDLNWKKVGPANRRNYFIADLNNLPESLTSLVNLLISPLFVFYLKEVTGLSLEPYQGEGQPGSKLLLELIRWSPGCYTMATDNDTFFQKPGLDLFIFFGAEKCLTSPNNSSGYVIYLDSEDDDETNDEDSDSELITLVPADNSMALVYRTDMTVRFTKYINHSINGEYYAIYATYYETEDNVAM